MNSDPIISFYPNVRQSIRLSHHDLITLIAYRLFDCQLETSMLETLSSFPALMAYSSRFYLFFRFQKDGTTQKFVRGKFLQRFLSL